MRKTKTKDIIITLILLLSALLVFSLKNEVLITLGIMILLLINFKIKYYKNEWKLFILGVGFGFVIEKSGDLIYKLQYWEQGSLFGIPIWLPLFWGYAFILIRRLGDHIIKK